MLGLPRLGRDKYLAAVIVEFVDRISNIPERAMVAGLLGSRKVDLGVPTAGQLFDRAHIDSPIMQVGSERRQIPVDKAAID